jgi:hypothetical protein
MQFVDNLLSQEKNQAMQTRHVGRKAVGAVFFCILVATLRLQDGTASAASTIYYCPDRPEDQQYSARSEPGCVPLVDTTRQERGAVTPQRHFKVENLQQDVAAFLSRYKAFLECCKTDLGELREIEDMADELDQLSASTQANLSNYSLASRGIMLRELLPPIAKVKGDLKLLRARLEQIGELASRMEMQELQPGTASRQIRELEESIDRDIHAPTLPGSAKTGTSIGAAPPAGPAIGRSPKTGTEIGQQGLTGHGIGTRPNNSQEMGNGGLSGFAIGGTGRAGPAIGQSTLNQDTSSGVTSTLQRSTTGSSISDSTVGSSLLRSTIGSSTPDTSGSSGIGSDAQNR